jgi:tetratricopeptide (TPR) repeat protein
MNFNKRLRLADEKFEAGKKAFDSLKYQEAADSFLAAAELSKGIKGNETGYAGCLVNAANALDKLGYYDKALSLLEKAIPIQKKFLGSQDATILNSLNQLAIVHKAQGNYEKAIQLYEQILAVQVKDAGYLRVASWLNNLALVYMEKGDYIKARQFHENALFIRKQQLNPNHPNISDSLNNLALIYTELGNYKKAEQLQKNALAIEKKIYGSEHPKVGASLGNLADIYSKQCNYEEAKRLFEQALCIQEKNFGFEHPEVAGNLNGLAIIYKLQGDYAKAQHLCEQALAIWEKVLGSEHANVVTTLGDLAVIHKEQGHYLQAKALYERAITIGEKSLGLEHSKVAISLNNLSALYQEQGDYYKAEQLQKKALIIFEKSLGSEHPNVAGSLNNLAEIYQAQGNIEKAKEYYQRAQIIINKVFDENHPTAKMISENYLKLQREVEELKSRDIKNRVALEEAKKLEYLSYMATGIAHNINNPVGIIRAAAQRGLMDIDQGISLNVEDGQEIFQGILEESDRLHKIIEGFREFAKGDRKRRENVSINKLIEQIRNYFQNQLESKNIVLKLELSPDNPCSYANFFILQEVLINLVHNAREILENTPDATISIRTWQQAEKVGFTVEDNGTGIPAEQQKNLFMPFHSTKAHGMGLGLHFTYKSLLEINATITYQDCTPHGARFIIELPPATGETS